MAENFFPIMQNIAANGLAKQVRNPGDFYDDDGFLCCGKCGERRQKMRPFPNPTPDHMTELMVAVDCLCEREAAAEKERLKKAQEDLDRMKKLRAVSLMEKRFEDAAFGVFKINKYNERNLRLCQRYVDKFDQMAEKNQGLLFWGDVGTGKSFAAACIANALLQNIVPVIMTSFTAINKALDSDSSKMDEIIAQMRAAKLVIFDDLGAERDTDTSIERVYHIIDSRYRMKLPMIITTNLSLDQMKSEDDVRLQRIYDRVFEACFPMQFTGPSWRRRSAAKSWTEMSQLLEEE